MGKSLNVATKVAENIKESKQKARSLKSGF